MIAAAAETSEEERILRVAAYCRVSTDDIDQALSIHLQIQQYMKKIKESPNWKYAGCYVDDGFLHRPVQEPDREMPFIMNSMPPLPETFH